MSPRRNRPQRPAPPHERENGLGHGGVEEWQGEDWVVRSVTGAAAAKHYRCPGCDQDIPPGVGHVVAWREYGGLDDRRHWHRACWNAKDRRTSKVQRSRNAPRY